MAKGKEQPAAHVPAYIQDIKRHFPSDWENPKVRVVRLLMEQSGLLPSMVRRNPDLTDKVTSFFAGEKDIMVVGGESGMGKSLITAELQRLHSDLQLVMPKHMRQPMAIFGWDRIHQQFFDQVSLEAGQTVSLPKGETHPIGRTMVSQELRDLVRFIKTRYTSHPKVLIETPLIDNRGELVLEGLPEFKDQIQVLIMHSPETRRETMAEGKRDKETSNHIEGMEEMREKLLRRILGDLYKGVAVDQQDLIIKMWWEQKMERWDGMVVHWDPNDDRSGFNDSRALYNRLGIQSDSMSPRIGRIVRRDIENTFEGIADMDGFLKSVIG